MSNAIWDGLTFEQQMLMLTVQTYDTEVTNGKFQRFALKDFATLQAKGLIAFGFEGWNSAPSVSITAEGVKVREAAYSEQEQLELHWTLNGQRMSLKQTCETIASELEGEYHRSGSVYEAVEVLRVMGARDERLQKALASVMNMLSEVTQAAREAAAKKR